MSDTSPNDGLVVTDRTEFVTRPPEVKRKSGVRSIIDKVQGTYFTTSEVAEQLGVSQNTVRRWYRKGVHKAPSKQIQRGKLTIYLYTPEDVQELRDYYEYGETND